MFDGTPEAASVFELLAPHTDPTLGVRFHHLAMADNLLAGVSSTLATSLLALWDVRTGRLVNAVRAADHPLWQRDAHRPPAAVLLDEYKLVLGTPAGIAVHDIRASCGLEHDYAWPHNVRTLVTSMSADEMAGADASGAGTDSLTCLAVHGKRMVAGFDGGGPCRLWAFGSEAIESTPLVQEELGDLSLIDKGEGKGKKNKKPKDVPKRQQNRYPKRGR